MSRIRNTQILPIDRGWAWVVLFAVVTGDMLGYGYLTCLGIFYTEWKDYFGLTATATSLLLCLPWMVASPFCEYNVLCHKAHQIYRIFNQD